MRVINLQDKFPDPAQSAVSLSGGMAFMRCTRFSASWLRASMWVMTDGQIQRDNDDTGIVSGASSHAAHRADVQASCGASAAAWKPPPDATSWPCTSPSCHCPRLRADRLFDEMKDRQLLAMAFPIDNKIDATVVGQLLQHKGQAGFLVFPLRLRIIKNPDLMEHG